MSRYRKIDPRIWNDAKFRELSDAGKLVFFMLLTHPSMTALGAMRASLSGLAEELGWEPEAFREAFREGCLKGMAEHDAKACFVALPNFLKYNPPESPNVIKAWVSALDMLPECGLKTRAIARAKAFAEGMTEGFAKALPEAFAKAMPYQEQEQEQEQERKEMSADADEPESRPAKQPASARFVEFWDAYPRREGKKAALQAWQSKRLDRLADSIIEDVNRRKASHRPWLDGFVPHAATYLRGERWCDDLTTGPQPKPNGLRGDGPPILRELQ